jgi:succinoglycan biosynthesis transport protein ExoP
VPTARSPTRTDVDGVHALDLNNYVRVVQRHWRALVVVIAVSLLGSAVAAWAQPTLYETSTTLVATVSEGASPQDESTRRQAAAQRAATLAQFAATAPVQQAVITAAARDAGLPVRIPNGVVAAADGSTPFLTITVTDEDPLWAQAVANAYRTAMPRGLTDIDESVATAAEQVTTLTPALVPQTPVGPDRTQYLLFGALLGLVLGLGLIVLRESLARHVTEPEDVGRALALPVLGIVPQEEPKRALPMRSAQNSSRAEAYRAVLANLPFLTVLEDAPQSLLITGTTTGEGVTTLAGNLAIALARSGRRVLLVDANLRAPRIHEIFDLPAGPGLSEVLAGESTLAEAIHVIDGGSLRVLTAGEPPADPVERLTSGKATALLASIGSDADVVVFDSPPAVPVADALFLARQVSSVILTTRVGTTRKDRLLRAGDALHQVRAPLAGVVVNGTAGRDDRLRPRRRHGRAPVRPTPLSTPPAPAAAQPSGRESQDGAGPHHAG